MLRGQASKANGLRLATDELSMKSFVPLHNLRADPLQQALDLDLRCFLVTSLHQQRSDPLSAGQRKLWLRDALRLRACGATLRANGVKPWRHPHPRLRRGLSRQRERRNQSQAGRKLWLREFPAHSRRAAEALAPKATRQRPQDSENPGSVMPFDSAPAALRPGANGVGLGATLTHGRMKPCQWDGIRRIVMTSPFSTCSICTGRNPRCGANQLVV